MVDQTENPSAAPPLPSAQQPTQPLAACRDENLIEVAGAVWIIPPMLTDAEAGRFGEPIVLPITHLDTPAFTTSRLIYRDKVERFKASPDVLAKPALISQNDDGSIHVVFDGRHRLTALQETGATHFRAWSVPVALMEAYAIPPELLIAAVELVFSAALAEPQVNMGPT